MSCTGLFCRPVDERVIYRSTYKSLYLFQITLQETGQFVMASTVPVRTERRSAITSSDMEAVDDIDHNTSDQRLLAYQRDPIDQTM